jgi:Tol biopolymer transport system component/tRNA A-37 threonylcarbamoyl transferase component Bud32
MGEVYRARDTRLERTVAIKVLNSALSATPDLKARFDREAKAISQLNHPNICVLHDVGHQDGTDFLVMEFLDGESLADRLKNRGALPLADIIKIGSEIADALDKAHRAGIIHRDLKPGNVMLTRTGAKLLDFGLAKPAAMGAAAGSASAPLLSAAMTMTTPAQQHSPLTQQGSLVGTVQYMSPEQIQGIEADPRSDIFAFGAMLYEMATGKRAFEGKSQIKVASAILEDEPQPISVVQKTAPAALDRLIRTCLAKNPDERFQSALDVKLNLRWLADAPAETSPTKPGAAAHAIWMALTLLFGVGLLVAAYFAFTSAKPKPVIRASLLPPEKTTFVTQLALSGPPELSPDGASVVFSARDQQGRMQLYIRPLNSMAARPMPGSDGAAYPFWSPDSRNVGFFAEGKLKRMDASGGPALVLADAPVPRGGAWAPDGTIVFSPSTVSALLQVSSGGGTPKPASRLQRTEGGHRWPFFLPDGKHFLFWMRAAGSIGIGELGSEEHKTLFDSSSNAIFANGHVLYVKDGILMARPFSTSTLAFTGDPVSVAEHVVLNGNTFRGVFSASRDGELVYQTGESEFGWPLVWMDRDGRRIGQFKDLARYLGPAISPDGNRVAVSIATGTGNVELWVFDLVRGTRTRLTFDNAVAQMATWTPDGKSILYSSNKSGTYDVYRKSADGAGEAELLTNDKLDSQWKSVSRDGRYMAFMRQSEHNGWDIWGMTLADHKAFPILQSPYGEVDPQISPDGKWMAYGSDESGTFQIYITAFPGGGPKWQVSTNSGMKPLWRGDGKELFYLGMGTRELMSADVTLNASSVTLGATHDLFPAISVEVPYGPFDVTRDGKKFLVNTQTMEEGNRPFTLVTNWPASLKK